MFGLGKTREKRSDTALGPAIVCGGVVEALPWRYRGILLEVTWPEGTSAPVRQFHDVQADFDRLMQQGLTFLGVDEFPQGLRTIIVRGIEFGFEPEACDWAMTFVCVESPDVRWIVKFKDGKPSDMIYGD